jgi:hypothetical protein
MIEENISLKQITIQSLNQKFEHVNGCAIFSC